MLGAPASARRRGPKGEVQETAPREFREHAMRDVGEGLGAAGRITNTEATLGPSFQRGEAPTVPTEEGSVSPPSEPPVVVKKPKSLRKKPRAQRSLPVFELVGQQRAANYRPGQRKRRPSSAHKTPHKKATNPPNPSQIHSKSIINPTSLQ